MAAVYASESYVASNEILSAVLVLAFGYVIGHLLQSLLTTAIRSDFQDKNGRKGKPSDIALDFDTKGLSNEARKTIVSKVREIFYIDLSDGNDGDEKLSKSRNAAFLMVRAMLIQQKLLVYGEQFQGLYAMMRGLSMCCILGPLYLFSWAALSFKRQCIWYTAIAGCCVAVGILVGTGILRLLRKVDEDATSVDLIALWALIAVAISVGYLLGFHREIPVGFWKIPLSIGILCLFAGERFLIGYTYFAFEFARSVWRDFAAIDRNDTPVQAKL